MPSIVIQNLINALPDKRVAKMLKQVFDRTLPTGDNTAVTALAGGVQATATKLKSTCIFHEITVCATAGDAVALPAAKVGEVHVIKNSGATAAQVFGDGTDTIDSVATATGVPLGIGDMTVYACLVAGNYISNSFVGKKANILTATKAITAAESGSTFFLNSATEFVSTLPAPALGLNYEFIVKAAPSGASYTVVTTSSANIIIGNQNSVAGDAGDTGTADDTISFVDGQSVAGDKVKVISDGTSWFAYAISKVAAGITFTQAS